MTPTRTGALGVRWRSCEEGERLLGRGPVVDHRHQRAGDPRGMGVLDDVAPVDDPGGALREERGRAREDLGLGRPAAAADKDGDPAGDLDDLVVRPTRRRSGRP